MPIQNFEKQKTKKFVPSVFLVFKSSLAKLDVNLLQQWYSNVKNILLEILIITLKVKYLQINNQGGVSEDISDFSVFSNPADAQNASCLGLCDRNICPKNFV